MNTATQLSLRIDTKGITGAEPSVNGLLAGTQVRTLDGLIPVEFLEPGDRIVTRDGARQLMAISVL